MFFSSKSCSFLSSLPNAKCLCDFKVMYPSPVESTVDVLLTMHFFEFHSSDDLKVTLYKTVSLYLYWLTSVRPKKINNVITAMWRFWAILHISTYKAKDSVHMDSTGWCEVLSGEMGS